MRYFVFGSDGNKYGPADVPTLQAWMQEGRLRPETMLEEDGTGRRLTAAELGLGEPQQVYPPQQPQQQPMAQPGMSPYMQPPGPGSPYPRPQGASNTQALIVIGWICATVSLCFCPIVFGTVGIVMGIIASQRGDQRGRPLMVASIIFLAIGFVIGIAIGISGFWDRLR